MGLKLINSKKIGHGIVIVGMSGKKPCKKSCPAPDPPLTWSRNALGLKHDEQTP